MSRRLTAKRQGREAEESYPQITQIQTSSTKANGYLASDKVKSRKPLAVAALGEFRCF